MLFCSSEYSQSTEKCQILRSVLEKLTKEGYLTEFVDRRGGSNSSKEIVKQMQVERWESATPSSTRSTQVEDLHDLRRGKQTHLQHRKENNNASSAEIGGRGNGNTSGRRGRNYIWTAWWQSTTATHNDALVITIDVARVCVTRIFVDMGS